MNNEAPHSPSHLFTLRVWLEVLGDGQSEWRGQVRYVVTGETYYFREWNQLRKMLMRCLPTFDLEPGNWLQSNRTERSKQSEDQLRDAGLGIGEEEERPARSES
jgi:hypothetical protein